MERTGGPLRIGDKASSGLWHTTNLPNRYVPNNFVSEANVAADSEPEKDEKQSHIYEFFTTTSLHGFAHFADASRVVVKVFWALIIVICMFAVVRGMYRTIEQYIKNPTVTSVTRKSEPSIDMPDISICLPHRVNKSFLGEHNMNVTLLEYMNGVFIANHPNVLAAEYDMAHMQELEGKYQEFLARSHFKPHHIEEFYEEGALDCDKVFRKCDFGGNNLGGDCCDHVQKIMMSYGACFLIDPRIHGRRARQIYAGPHGGLTLLIQIHPQDRPAGFFNSLHDDGIFLHIGHAHLDHKPVPLDNAGIVVAPATHAYVALKARIIKRLKGYGCNEHAQLAFFDGYEQQTCLYECILNQTLKYCNCVPLGHNVSHHLPAGAQVCDPFEGNTCLSPYVLQHPGFDVTAEKLQQFQEELAVCGEGCERMCDTEVYSSKVMYSRFPSKELEQSYMDHYNIDPLLNVPYQFAMIEIYFSNIEEEIVEQVMSSTIDELISNIGGQVGLFIGSSLISLVHVISGDVVHN